MQEVAIRFLVTIRERMSAGQLMAARDLIEERRNVSERCADGAVSS
jgi:hypothetical protein